MAAAWLVKDKTFYKRLFLLALPIALQNIITYSVGLADNIMVGSLGELSLSGVYMANQVMTILQMLVKGLGTCCAVLSTQYWGKRDISSVKNIVGITFKFAFGLALLFFALAFFFPRQVLSLYTNESAVIDEAFKYLQIICFSYIFFAITESLIASMRCVETVRIGTMVSLSTLIINVSLNWVLIFGNLGAPALGIRGAAIATLIARIIETLIMVFYVKRIDKKLHLKVKDLFGSANKLLLKDFFHYGIPILAGDLIWSLNMTAQGMIIGRLGSNAIAAISIANVVFSMVSFGVYGIANATSIIIGKTVGEEKYDLVKMYAKTLQIIFLIGGAVTGLILFTLKDIILLIYDLDSATLGYARQFLTVLSVTVVGTGYQMSALTGIVRAGGATHFVFVNDTIFVWGVVIPSALLAAFVFKAEPWIVFACLKCDQILKCFVAIVKVNRFKWIKKLTRDELTAKS